MVPPVDDQAGDGDAVLILLLCRRVVLGKTAQLRLDPGDELQGPEGLRHIVVRAQGEPGDLVDLLILGGEHDDGKILVFPDFLADGKAAHVRQHHIQDGQVRRLLLQPGQGVCAIVKFVYLVGFVRQI